MSYFSDSETYYRQMRALFAAISEQYPLTLEAIGRANLNIRLTTTDPAASIIVHGRKRPVLTTFGDDDVMADLEIQMTGDTFHRILLDELSLRQALGSGEVTVRGPIWKALSLGDLFTVGQRCYPAIVEQDPSRDKTAQ